MKKVLHKLWVHRKAIAWVVVVVVAGLTLQQVRDEGKTREEQFCHLVRSNFNDRSARLVHTEEYLESKPGMKSTSLNNYIRSVSLPQTREEVDKEEELLPPVCIPDKEKP